MLLQGDHRRTNHHSRAARSDRLRLAGWAPGTACAVLCLAALTLCASRALAWVADSFSVAAVKTATPPPLEPSLASPAWAQALKMTDFYDLTRQRAARLDTTAYLLYDDSALYCLISSRQSGVPITASQHVDNAGLDTDDHVGLDLDTSGNGSRVYEFRVNPAGVHDEYSSENSLYTPRWTSLAATSPAGDYTVLMVIPLSILRLSGAPVQQWRFNVVRFIAATNSQYTWAYEPSMNSPDAPQFWPVLSDIRLSQAATRRLPRADIYGLVSAGSNYNVFQNGTGTFSQQNPRHVGLDLSYPLTGTLAFVGTVNPDFSNVELDQTIIAPQEFQRQYVEYRPFFAEGAPYINSLPNANVNTYQTLFYTPSIGTFNNGEKIEGTIGRSAFGLLNASGTGVDDRAFGYSYTLPDNVLSLDLENVFAQRPTIRDEVTGYGASMTNPHSGFAALALFAADRNTFTLNDRQADEMLYGVGLQNSHFVALTSYRDIGPEFAPLDGYTPINDIRGPQGFLQYQNGGSPKSGINTYTVGIGADRYVDRTGRAHQSDVFGSAGVTFKDLLSFSYGDSQSQLLFYQTPYPVYQGPFFEPFKQQSVAIGYRDGTPQPADVSYSWGPFGTVFLRQITTDATRQWAANTASLQYSETFESPLEGSGPSQTQSLWRISLTHAFGKDSSLGVAWRDVAGLGGIAQPGANLALSYSARIRGNDFLYVNYGTPAAPQTLHRLIVKYVFHIGGSNGT
jgi:hypothetical protein